MGAIADNAKQMLDIDVGNRGRGAKDLVTKLEAQIKYRERLFGEFEFRAKKGGKKGKGPKGKKEDATTQVIADAIEEEFFEHINAEIGSDQEGKGYAGKSAAQIAKLLNQNTPAIPAVPTTYIQLPGDADGSRGVVDVRGTPRIPGKPAPWFRVVLQLPYAPAECTEDHVRDAKAVK